MGKIDRESLKSYKLCYVNNKGFAWFTSCDLKDQWGDDWDDAPYEHNAGDPYDTHYVLKNSERIRVRHDLLKVAWEGTWHDPCYHHHNSPWSVKQINSGAIAWLIPEESYRNDPEIEAQPIHAGTDLLSFIQKIETGGGSVYLPREVFELF